MLNKIWYLEQRTNEEEQHINESTDVATEKELEVVGSDEPSPAR
jgi:hypothetical protein